MTSLACPLCGGSEHLPVSNKDRDGHTLHNHLCLDCGLVFVNPRPSQQELQDWYAQDYRRDYKGVLQPKSHHVLRAGRVALDRLLRIRPLLAGQPRMLDVGSGGGELLYLLTHLAGARAEGLEPNQGYARHARDALGLPVHEGFLSPDAPVTGGYDLITIHHVLEHLADPVAAMQLMHRWLRPGGHLVVEVPNVEATCQSPASSFHRAHLYTWGLPTLERLAMQSGLSPISATASADGGNITVVFQRDDSRQWDPALIARHTRGYGQQVRQVLQGHTPLRHYLSWRPLWRTLRRLQGQVGERIAVQGNPGPRAILDGLIAASRQTSHPRPLPPQLISARQDRSSHADMAMRLEP